MKIYQQITQLIGKTPLLKANNFISKNKLNTNFLVKLEGFNPSGSIKDRVANALIEQGEQLGLLKKGGTVIEPTSGNTGIALASICALKGYKLILTMPDTMSRERVSLLRSFGADLVLTKGDLGMQGAILKAKEFAKKIENSFMPSQFENPVNPLIHSMTTGVEIWEDTDGLVDIVIIGIGSGGTISGVGEFLKGKKPSVKIIGVEPLSSPFITTGKKGEHNIQGIGAGFLPKTLNTKIYDEVICVSDTQAINTSKTFIKNEGYLVGISSGAVLYGGIEISRRAENFNKTIVSILPDLGDRYFSTPLFS